MGQGHKGPKKDVWLQCQGTITLGQSGEAKSSSNNKLDSV